MHYLLFYEVADDYVSKRAPHREDHLRRAWEASLRGELILGGAFADPADGAVLLFTGDSPQVAEQFARNDPYVTSGAVRRWYVRAWTTVVGKQAATPIYPATMQSHAIPPHESLSTPGTIMRMWKARCSPEKAGDYARHAQEVVFPALRRIDGHRGAYLLRRNTSDEVEFAVLTLWDSMAAIGRFAGPKPDKAVVEPKAQTVLKSFDQVVSHFEVVHSTEV